MRANTGLQPAALRSCSAAAEAETLARQTHNGMAIMNMKKTLGLMAVVAAIGVWAGMSYGRSASVTANVETGIAILIGSNLLFCLWLWHRALPGSGDAMVLPTLMLMLAAMLLGILPRLFWPEAERLHIAGSIGSVAVSAVLLINQIRRRRNLRSGARPV